MKYLIGPLGWECRQAGVGRRWIEPGTFVDDSLPYWSFVLGQGGPPVDALPMDQATYDAFVRPQSQGGLGYEYWRVRPYPYAGIVLSGPGSGYDYWAQHPIP
jgi:hypothetical protein